jgi:hypothetical protein
MKRTIWVLTATALLAGMALLAGCGGSSGTASDAGAQGGAAVQQGTQQGLQGGAVSEPDLTDVPIYPGAVKQTMPAGGPGGGGAGGNTQGGTQGNMRGGTPPSGAAPGSMSMVMYTTTDSVDTVTAWYREQLSGRDGFTEATGQAGPDGGTQAVFTFTRSSDTISIAVGAGRGNQGGTMIRIAEGTMQAPSGTPPTQSQ